MLDLACRRGEAVEQYKAAMAIRDGALDTLVAAEHGEKAAYAVNGHSCEADADAGEAPAEPEPAAPGHAATQNGAGKPQ